MQTIQHKTSSLPLFDGSSEGVNVNGKRLFGGFPVSIFSGNCDSKFICYLCNGILKNPIKYSAGARCCKTCMAYEISKLPQEASDNRISSTNASTCIQKQEKSVEDDDAFKSELGDMNVLCIRSSTEHNEANGCSWKGTLNSIDNHIAECSYLSKPDDQSGQKSRKITPESATETSRLCPPENDSGHSEESEISCFSRLRSCSTADHLDLNRRDHDSGNTIQNQNTVIDHIMLLGMIHSQNKQIEILTNDLSSTRAQMAELVTANSHKEDAMDNMAGYMNSLGSVAANIQDQIGELRGNRHCVESTCTIEGISEKMEDARSGKIEFIESPPFYLSGYKLCTRVYLNEKDSMGCESIGMGIRIMEEDTNKYLTWPMMKMDLVQFMILDQSGQECPIILLSALCLNETSTLYKHNKWNGSVINPNGFVKPRHLETNPCAGIVHSVVYWNKLVQSSDLYLANDSLKLKTVVREKQTGPCYIQQERPSELMGF